MAGEKLIIENLSEHPEHVPTVAAWIYEEWGQGKPGKSVETFIQYMSELPGSTGLPLSVIALQENEVVGVARLVEHDLEERPNLSPWLASVYVPESQRGKGIGGQLCQTVVKKAGEKGFKEIYLFTPDREPFYFHQGWEFMEYLEHNGERVVVMKINPSV